MSRARLRVPFERVVAGEAKLDEGTARYVTRVHRLGVGDVFTAFDPGAAMEADAELVAMGRAGCRVRMGPTRAAELRASRRVTLLQGIGKGDKLDAVVRDATELGATRVVPVITERSVSRPREVARTDRWRRIAIEAARQSGRGDAPVIEPPTALREGLGLIGEGTIALCLDPASDTPIGPVLRSLEPRAEVALLVGPEGGLSPEELEAAERAGFRRVSLGRLTLRTETVCAAVLGALLALAEDEA